MELFWNNDKGEYEQVSENTGKPGESFPILIVVMKGVTLYPSESLLLQDSLQLNSLLGSSQKLRLREGLGK